MTERAERLAPTICKCGSAQSYHRPSDRRDHEYEPRYDPKTWREARNALRANLRAGADRLSRRAAVLRRSENPRDLSAALGIDMAAHEMRDLIGEDES